MPTTLDSLQRDLNEKINAIINSAKTAAISIGKSTVGFSPAGDYIDFCEMATSWESCNPNGEKLSIAARALSGAGLIIGNGRLWRNIATEAKLIKNVEKIEDVAQEIEKIADSAGRIGAKTGEEFKQFAGTLKKHKLDVPKFPENIGFRANLKKHLSEIEEFTQESAIKGAHNADAFEAAFKSNGCKLVSETPHPSIPGIKEVKYQIPALAPGGLPGSGYKAKIFPKTIYDPKIISDIEILQLGQLAAAKGFEKALANGLRSYTEEVAGLKFIVYIKDGFVDNVFPILN